MILHQQLTLARKISPAPGDRALIAIEVAKLVSAFPAQQTNALVGALNADAYLEALHGLPAWAVAEARKLIFSGYSAYGRPFGPTPVQLADLVRNIVRPFQEELEDLKAMHEAATSPEADPEVKQYIADGLSDLADSMRMPGRGGRRRPPTDDEIREGVAKRLASYPRRG